MIRLVLESTIDEKGKELPTPQPMFIARIAQEKSLPGGRGHYRVHREFSNGQLDRNPMMTFQTHDYLGITQVVGRFLHLLNKDLDRHHLGQ